MPEDQSPNPLDSAEVSELSINDLIASDPRDLSDTQLERIVREVRSARSRWAAEESTAKREGRKPKTSLGLSIDTLELDLGSVINGDKK